MHVGHPAAAQGRAELVAAGHHASPATCAPCLRSVTRCWPRGPAATTGSRRRAAAIRASITRSGPTCAGPGGERRVAPSAREFARSSGGVPSVAAAAAVATAAVGAAAVTAVAAALGAVAAVRAGVAPRPAAPRTRGTRRRSRAGRCSRARRPPRSPRGAHGAGVPAPRRQGAAAGRWAAAPFGRACAATPARSRGPGGGGRGARRGSGPASSTRGQGRGEGRDLARGRGARVASTPAPVASTGFQRPARRSSSRSSSASRRWARRPKAAPVTASGAALSGRPARTAVCANAADTASAVGAVASSSVAVPPRSIACWRAGTASSAAGSKPAGAVARARSLQRSASRRPDRRDRRVPEGALAVVGVVGDVAGRQQQRGVRRQPGAVAGWPRWRCASRGRGRGRRGGRRSRPGIGCLCRGEHRDEQGVDVGRGPRELAVTVAQGEAGAAQVRRPAAVERGGEVVTAGPHDAEHAGTVVRATMSITTAVRRPEGGRSSQWPPPIACHRWDARER